MKRRKPPSEPLVRGPFAGRRIPCPTQHTLPFTLAGITGRYERSNGLSAGPLTWRTT